MELEYTPLNHTSIAKRMDPSVTKEQKATENMQAGFIARNSILSKATKYLELVLTRPIDYRKLFKESCLVWWICRRRKGSKIDDLEEFKAKRMYY